MLKAFSNTAAMSCAMRWAPLAVVLAAWLGPAHAQEAPQPNICGSLSNHYGPFDYRTEKGKLIIVESNHFTPVVRTMWEATRSKSSFGIRISISTRFGIRV